MFFLLKEELGWKDGVNGLMQFFLSPYSYPYFTRIFYYAIMAK